jgi:hypothetical protein
MPSQPDRVRRDQFQGESTPKGAVFLRTVKYHAQINIDNSNI